MPDDSKFFRDRRRVLSGIIASAGFAASAGSMRAWASDPSPAPHWPLWSIEHDQRRVYLFGETPPRQTAWHDARIEHLLPECSTLWTETNHDRSPDMRQTIARYGVDADKPLAKWLNQDDQDRLAKAAAFCHTPIASLAPYRPWLAGAILQDAYYAATGMNQPAADDVLAAEAKKTGISLSHEFPRKDDTIAWFGSMSPIQDIEYLRYVLDSILAGPVVDERMYADWSMGRLERATEFMRNLTRKYPQLFEKITVERNRNWVPRIQTMLNKPVPSMVVVGMYHLVGPESLLSQLQKSGLKVHRI